MELNSKIFILLVIFTFCSGTNIEDDKEISGSSYRNGKLLFGNGANLDAIQELRARLDKLEAEVKSGSSYQSDDSFMQPRFLEQTRVNITTAFSNITNLYTKVKALRAANALKCSKKKCENIRTKVKKVNKELEFLKNINVTQLQETIATINTFQNTITSLQSSLATLESTSTAQQASITALESTSTTQQATLTAQQASITALESTSTTQQASITALETKSTAQQTSITALESTSATQQTSITALETTNTAQQTDIDTVKTSVTSLTTANTQQQTQIDTVETKVTTIETTVTSLQTSVTSNTDKVTKVNNCFADINSADCPSAKRRNGRDLDNNNLEEDVGNNDYDDLGPHPSLILKNIFRANRAEGKGNKKKKNHKRKKYRQGTTALIPALKILVACMNDNTAATCTAEYSASTSIPSQLGSVSTLSTDVTAVKACLTDPTASACTSVYSGASTLPASVSTLSTDLTPVKACMTDPSAAGCTGTYSGASSLPGIATSISTLNTDVTTLKSCMTDPTAAGCTGTYSAATTLASLVSTISGCMTDPAASACTTTYSAATTLPQVLSGKCPTSTCTTLTTDMTAVKSCLTDPTAAGCTGTYSAATTLPKIVSNVDKCMTNVEDATCTNSYGASTGLITAGGKSIVGYIQQLNKPSMIMCQLTDATVADYASSTGNNGCTPQLSKWAPLTWICSQTPQQDSSANSYYIEPDAAAGSAVSKITIKQAGYYKIELTALLTLNKFQHRIEVFKKSTGATCDKDTILLGVYARDNDTGGTVVGKESSSNTEGFYNLAANDELIVIASTSGNAVSNTETEVEGDAAITKTSWIITRLNY